ncbi:MAG: L-lactate permease [Ktedonobacteraceae bacterium]
MVTAIALLPLVVAAVALIVWQRPGRDASLLTVCATLLIVVFFLPFHLSPVGIALSAGDGGATALTIIAILIPALLFYQVQNASGSIPVLQRGIAKMVPDRDLQILLLVLGVGPAVESVCGFGVGAVVIIPLLGALEADTLRVAKLSLFSQIISPWGALSVSTSLAATFSGVHVNLLSIQTAFLLVPASLCFALLTLMVGGGRKSLERHWLLALCASCLQIGGVLLGGQILGVALAGVAGSLVVVVFLLMLGLNRWDIVWQALVAHYYKESTSASPLLRVLTPYLLLVASLAATRLLPAVSDLLQTRGVWIFEPLHLHFALLYSPGVCLLFAALAPFALFSSQAGVLRASLVNTYRQSVPSLTAIVGFFVAAALMQDSGMVSELSSVTARIGPAYMWISTLIGGASGWLTGSALDGNTLSVPIQMQASAQVGLPWIIAAQNASTALASIASPTRVILVIAVSGALGQEGILLRKIGPVILWSIALMTVLLVWFLSHAPLSLVLLLILLDGPLVLIVTRSRGRKADALGTSQFADCVPLAPAKRVGKRVLPRFLVQACVYSGLFLSYILYGSYSPVIEPMLRHLDPLVFFCLSLLPLSPIALWLLLQYKALLDRTVLIRGGLLGSCLGISFLCLTMALKDTNINETTVFSCVNGVTAAFIAWLVFRQRIGMATWAACLSAVAGAVMVAVTSSLHWQGDFVAFVGGSLLVVNTFLVEHLLISDMRKRPQIFWPILGVQLLVMVAIATLFALCAGSWQGVTSLQFSDIAVIGYIALPGTLVPIILLTLLQQYVSAVTTSFFAIIDPLAAAVLAFLAGERLSLLGYIGFGFVLLSVLFQAIMGARETLGEVEEKVASVRILQEEEARYSVVRGSPHVPLEKSVLLPLVQSDVLGAHSRTILAYLANAPQGLDLRALRHTTGLSHAQLHHLLAALHRRGYVELNTQHQYVLHPERCASVWEDCRILS